MKNKNVLIVLGILVVVAIAFFMLNKKFAIQKTADGLPAAAVSATNPRIDLCDDGTIPPCDSTEKTTTTTTITTAITPKSTTLITTGGACTSSSQCYGGNICEDGRCTTGGVSNPYKLSCDPSTGAICDPTATAKMITAIPPLHIKGGLPDKNVTTIQQALQFYCPESKVDGFYGPTMAACIDYVRALLGLTKGKIDATLLGKLNISITPPSTLRESPTRASTGKASVLPLIQNGFVKQSGSGYVPSDGTNIFIDSNGKISFTNIANQRIDLGICAQ